MSGLLLDTNVLSELMRPQPAPSVLAWFARQALAPPSAPPSTAPQANFFISSVTQAEILLGIALLPAGKRRAGLAAAADAMFAQDFAGRCLPFDNACSAVYAVLVAQRMALGRPISTEDAQIAAIAVVNGLTLVTRNGRDFDAVADLAVIDPWMTSA